MEDWKRLILSDTKLNTLMKSENFSSKQFVLSLLLESNSIQFSEIFQKMNSIKNSLTLEFNEKVNINFESIITNIELLNKISVNTQDSKEKISQIKFLLDDVYQTFTSKYEILQEKIPILENTYKAILLCNVSQKFLQHIKLLKSLVSENNYITDLSKASYIINELFKLARETNLNGLEFYENEKQFINNIREQIVQKNEKKFAMSLETKNISELTSCLQIYQNLNNITEVIQGTANNYLQKCMEMWKNCLTKEYNGQDINKELNLTMKQTLSDCLNQTQQVWALSLSLKQNDINSLLTFEEYFKSKNLSNIFELFWDKQQYIIEQSLKKLNDSQKKYLKNWKAIIKNYPRIHKLFLDFIQNLNEAIFLQPMKMINREEKNQELINNLTSRFVKFIGTIEFLQDFYQAQLKTEIQTRKQACLTALSQPSDKGQVGTYFQAVSSEIAKYCQVLSFELKENLQEKHFFDETTKIILFNLNDFLQELIQNYCTDDQQQLSIYILLSLMNTIIKIIKEPINQMMTSKHNSLLDKQILDSLLGKFTFANECIIEKYLNKIFPEMFKYISNLYENHQFQQKNLAQQGGFSLCSSIFEQILQIFQATNPNTQGNLLDNNFLFEQEWEQFAINIINLYCISIASFIPLNQQAKEKFQDMILQEIEELIKIFSKLMRQDSQVTQVLMNLQKLLLMDANNLILLWESKHEIFSILNLNIILYFYQKQLEYEFNLQIQVQEKFKNFGEILLNFLDDKNMKTYQNFKMKLDCNFYQQILQNSLLTIISKKPEAKESPNYKFLENFI